MIYDGNHIAVYEGLRRLCVYANKQEQWCDELWTFMLEDRALLEEFIYYISHHDFLGKMKTAGYSMTDLYVQQLERFNLRQDSGKNTSACNKEEMVLDAFYTMAKLKKDPDELSRKWQEGFGMDKMS